MKALCWHGKQDVQINEVPDPEIILPTDAIIRVTTSAICGSDLHIYNNLISEMASGDILGHEFMGEVVAIGSSVKKVKIGDKVVVPFTISCGHCHFCKHKLFSLCEYSNPNAELARAKMGQSPAGVFGYSHLLGGFSGGQSEFVRVPYADIGCIIIPSGISDEKVLFLSDIFPTGYMAAENCDIQRGNIVAVWGCGPVGQFAIQSAWMLGAERVIAIDCEPERLELAQKLGKAEVINFKEENVLDALMVMTKGRGPECCIDAVGCEAHGHSMMEQAKEAMHLMNDKAHVLREAIQCCAKGGHISVPGVYLSTVDALPFSSAMNKGLTFKMGQTHVQRYLEPLLKKIMNGDIDPSKIITHRITLDEVPQAYKTFNDKADGCVKVVIKN